ncbi:replication endonuclease [Kushneria phyllosphaerae]|uniref:Replication gene A protein-like domain-containing protein n=1 Tax=Kushneria phyllosphaerae TaxID=2100822 RepID=A0A2R8CKV0_9GAMM|nr:replication endonuclease [Kushneria phyllosphaerae]SPJ33463.1 hypothetical protein KSP9073_01472 [Kushneria phyllosphaerae]
MTNAIEQSRAFGAPGNAKTPGCAEWRQTRFFDRFPLLAEDLASGFVLRAKSDGNAAGNRWLADVTRQLIAGPWNVTHDDEALVEHAKAQARAIEKRQSEIGAQLRDDPTATEADVVRQTLWFALKRAEEHHIRPDFPRRMPKSSQLARLSCSLWWRRNLRRLSSRRIEQVQRDIGRVHRRAGIYCSSVTVKRRSEQKARNNALLEAVEAINQHGQAYTLAELSELGLANPDHRRAELMLRIRDTEAEARRLGHAGLFYTLTCPSRFHPVRSKSCSRNPAYDGATPRDAQGYITALWARIRAQLAREELGMYGLRVVEPHHDGTPHWHMLIWADADNVERINEIMRDYALADSPDEPGAQRNRLKVVAIDPAKGSAAGYVAKYISKNINGQQYMAADQYGHAMESSAPRIEAWAAVWGIRQFQFVGLPSVTVWREVRRITEQQAQQLAAWEEATRPGQRVREFVRKLRTACNAGAWDQFLRLMGGPMTPRNMQPAKPWNVHKCNSEGEGFSRVTGEETVIAKGRYGEQMQVTFGVLIKGAEYLTRFYSWEMRRKTRAGAYDFSQKGSYGGSEASDPWTCVNNCTGPDFEARQLTPKRLSPQEEALQAKRYQEWQASTEYRAEIELAQQEHEEVQIALAELNQPAPPPSAWASMPEYHPI